MKNKEITVLTVTRNRCEYLKRAIETVRNQSYQGKISHLIIIDDCEKTLKYLEENYENYHLIKWIYAKRMKGDCSGPVLLAKLRNYAVDMAETEWVSFLDDDNEFEVEHYQKLMEFADSKKAEAVHCFRKILYRNGKPFLEKYWPWDRDKNNAIERYKYFLSLGLIESGSNIFKDNQKIVVDTNVWLLKRSILLENRISSDFTTKDWEDNLAEDDKLLEGLRNNNIRIECSEEPTVLYYLGGYSNDFSESVEGTEKWEKI
ncbi:MAG: glycosyltransferase family 2 protein [Fusobacteriaceae bacterium]|nr:glycosyltransferase family 2 protein [Fusobacteriaceae bacterium]